MGLFERLSGVRRPVGGGTPAGAAEVRDALLAVGGEPAPYRVRIAGSAEQGDLVADWRLRHGSPGEEVDLRLTVRLRLDPHRREVRAVQEQRSSSRGRLSASREYGRGAGAAVQWTYERGPDGRRRRVKTLDTREMKDALRAAVLAAGWTWRPRLTRL
ncbi:hypothetical protein [Streptomyces sp. NPDC089919]|uniref:hypothetical protein n=1 Tax=Streptomyces sp. NPDC089919 TaxID=3155188 RepID=UPI0034353BD9